MSEVPYPGVAYWWARSDFLNKEMYRNHLAQVQRLGPLRVVSTYRTFSMPAVMVIAGAISIALHVAERKLINPRKGEGKKEGVACDERPSSLCALRWSWEREWRDKWTTHLINDVRPWFNRQHDEVDYYLTQLLRGHGYFQSYLHTIGILRPPDCIYRKDVTVDGRASCVPGHHNWGHVAERGLVKPSGTQGILKAKKGEMDRRNAKVAEARFAPIPNRLSLT